MERKQTPSVREAMAADGVAHGHRDLDDFELQRLRILSCTARAMLNSPGGLRFKAGARPWLPGQAHEELAPSRRQPAHASRRWSAND
ncbi:hypothetical protein [Polaromonas sp. YR568]|uniref:hypothetical protein n=1 Tax=Polaromonas sp. YR568 TaxID=1855301 RepID=UPI003137BE6E